MKQLVQFETSANISDVERLVRLITQSKNAYYNEGEFYKAQPSEFPKSLRPLNAVQITDKRYDKLEDELRKLDPNHKLLRSVGVKPTGSRQKVKLPFYAGSLTKVRTAQEIVDWAEEYEGPYVLSDKIDGISILIKLEKGQYNLYTRGEATVGQDITHLATTLKLPPFKGSAKLRGELVMGKGKFDSTWSKHFKNPRNMAAGIANRKDVHDAVKDLTVMIYEVIEPRIKPSRALAWAKSKGFTVVPHKVVDAIDADSLNEVFMRRRTTGKYEVDGIVITQDAVHAPNKKPTPDWARAFKSALADETALARVTEVRWQVSRHGYLIPVLSIEAYAQPKAEKR